MTHAGDLAALQDDVRRLREQVDVVAVSMHWGIHFEAGTIADYQYEAAHAAVDAGADVILGHHGHVIKGIEYYKDKPVFYSPGNVTLLPRCDKGEPLTADGRVDVQMTMIAKLTIEGGEVSRVAIIRAGLTCGWNPRSSPGQPPVRGLPRLPAPRQRHPKHPAQRLGDHVPSPGGRKLGAARHPLRRGRRRDRRYLLRGRARQDPLDADAQVAP